MARLGDYIEQIRGVSYKPTDLRDFQDENSVLLLRANNIQDGNLNLDDVIYVSKNKIAEKQYLKKGDILICTSSGSKELVGKAAYVKQDIPISFGAFCKVVRPKTECKKYIGHFFQSPYYRRSISDLSAGANINNIRNEHIGDLEIQLPPLEEQRRIAALLDKVSDLIAKRRAQLDKLDLLVKARFVEMFGDPILNQKGFPCYTVGDIITFQGGSQPDKKHFEYTPTDENIRLIQIRDYKSDKFITYIPKVMAKRFCAADDIMIGRYGPPIFQILQGIEGAYNVALMKAIPKRGNKEFIRQFLKQDCLLEYLEGLSKRTAGQDGIQMDKLKEYPFPFPTMELQEKFEFFVKNIDKSKLTIQQSLDKLEILKKALMQQYFG